MDCYGPQRRPVGRDVLHVDAVRGRGLEEETDWMNRSARPERGFSTVGMPGEPGTPAGGCVDGYGWALDETSTNRTEDQLRTDSTVARQNASMARCLSGLGYVNGSIWGGDRGHSSAQSLYRRIASGTQMGTIS